MRLISKISDFCQGFRLRKIIRSYEANHPAASIVPTGYINPNMNYSEFREYVNSQLDEALLE